MTSFREPQSFDDFRNSIIDVIANIYEYHELAEQLDMIEPADTVFSPFMRAWESIEYEAAAHINQNMDFWEYHNDTVYDMLVNFANEYNESGITTNESINPGEFARNVVHALTNGINNTTAEDDDEFDSIYGVTNEDTLRTSHGNRLQLIESILCELETTDFFNMWPEEVAHTCITRIREVLHK
jgi:hypothetical protein